MTIVREECTQSIIRVFRDDEAVEGAPFDFAMVAMHDEGVVTIKALAMPEHMKLSWRDWHAIARHCKANGARRMVWHRKNAQGQDKREMVTELV